jgi:hypothetical protein
LDQLPDLIAQLRVAASGGASVPAARSPAAAAAASGRTAPARRPAAPPAPAARDAAPPPEPAQKKKPGVAQKDEIDLSEQPATHPSAPLSAESASRELTPTTAEAIWKDAIADLGGLTAEIAGDYDSVAISGPNVLAVRLRAAYNKEWCERPEMVRKIEEALGRWVGRTIRVEFSAIQTPAKAVTPRQPSGASNWKKMRDVEQHPLVQEAIGLFSAEIVRVEGSRETRGT